MKKLINLTGTLTLIFSFFAAVSMGQVTQSNNLPTLGNFVGFDANALIPLPIRNDGPVGIQWWTNQTRRMTMASNGNVALGNNQNPINFVKFFVLQNRPVGVGVRSTSAFSTVTGFQSLTNTASSETFDAANVGFFAGAFRIV